MKGNVLSAHSPEIGESNTERKETMNTTTTRPALKKSLLRLALLAGLAVTMSPLASCGGMERRDDRRDHRDDRRDTRQDNRDTRQDSRHGTD